MKINEEMVERMSVFLDYAAKRQQLITSNLANAETPGYRSKEIRFEDFLKTEAGETIQLKRTSRKHLAGKPSLIRSEVIHRNAGDTLGNDRNDVDLEKEMTELAGNVLKFSVVGRFLHHKLQMIRTSIKEGRM